MPPAAVGGEQKQQEEKEEAEEKQEDGEGKEEATAGGSDCHGGLTGHDGRIKSGSAACQRQSTVSSRLDATLSDEKRQACYSGNPSEKENERRTHRWNFQPRQKRTATSSRAPGLMPE